ncbi:7507_t:CDS:2, partial [Dentiscutata erythropus]
ILISMASKTVIEDVFEQTVTISSDLIHFESQETLPIDKSERIILLQREISTIRELLELEPDSKWCLQTLANLLREFKYIDNSKEVRNVEEVDEIVAIYDKLIIIDEMRVKRFEDL